MRRKEGGDGRETCRWRQSPEFQTSRRFRRIKSLKSFAGQSLVLYFYPKDDTTGCTKEAIDFNGLKGAFATAGAAIVGVSPDSTASHAKFKTKHKLDIELISDESKAMLEA
jgi:peroxiredoxin Q/BCP